MNAPQRLRVGHIEFLNCLPLYWGLERNGDAAAMDLRADTPDRLSDALVAGELDIAPISLVEALQHADELIVIPEVAVGAIGAVQSVCLVSSRPLVDVASPVVALGSTSRTSVQLARLILEQRWGLAPTYLTCAPDLDRMLEQADAAVLIGDPALAATLLGVPGDGRTVIDLAQEWFDWQRLPMVFALWAVRGDVARTREAEVLAVRTAFRNALTAAAATPSEVAAAGATVSGFTRDQLLRYNQGIDFTLGADQWHGIRAFAGQLSADAAQGAKTLQSGVLDPLPA